jgi:DNA ligase-1
MSAYVWLCCCRDYCEGLHDTLDLAVIGAWYGNGRKAG